MIKQVTNRREQGCLSARIAVIDRSHDLILGREGTGPVANLRQVMGIAGDISSTGLLPAQLQVMRRPNVDPRLSLISGKLE